MQEDKEAKKVFEVKSSEKRGRPKRTWEEDDRVLRSKRQFG